MSSGVHSRFKSDNLVIVGHTYLFTRFNAISFYIYIYCYVVSLQYIVIETVEQYTQSFSS